MTTTLRTATATLVAFLALGATAWAFFGATGSGSGTGTASGRPTVVIDAGVTPAATLLPTDAYNGTVTVQLDNQSPASVHVGSIVLDTSRPGGGYGSEAIECKVTFRSRDNNGTGWTLAPGVTQISLPAATKMGTDAPTTCQGREIRVFVKTTA